MPIWPTLYVSLNMVQCMYVSTSYSNHENNLCKAKVV